MKLVGFLVACVISVHLVAQTPASAPKSAGTAASSGGRDLTGIWDTATVTPMERPKDLAGKAYFTPAEAEAYEKELAIENDRDRRGKPGADDVARAYNEAWWDRGTKVVPSLRTSLIVDPADGRIPPLTPAARAAAQKRAAALQAPPNGPEDRGIQERCIVGVNVGPPIIPTVYNNNFQIFQSGNTVVVFSEMIHDYRVIPTDGSKHIPSDIRLWMGDSRGHWEGNTLVVDTTNFNGKTHFRGADENLHVIERFTRVKPDQILYQFHIEDPTAFERPWGGEFTFNKAKGLIYEYACHEGNYGLSGLLSAARAEEQKAAQKSEDQKH
jgi:hypothetical protein